MKKNIKYLVLCFASLVTFGQTLPPKQASLLNVRQIHSGHSLTDPLFNPWPGQYSYLIGEVLGGNFSNIASSTVPGSSMEYRWDYISPYGHPSARHNINNWELLVITERVPLLFPSSPLSNQQWYIEGLTNQRSYLSQFVNNSWTNGNNRNGAPTLLWTTWLNIDGSNGDFRQTLDVQGAEWEYMQDYANANLISGASPVYLIPGHKMMARLYDDIQLGLVPGITSINQFFEDSIHVNDLGAYAVAMIHYACIYNKNPTGITNSLFYPNLVQNHTTPSPQLANYLQNMIWDVVTNYSRTGVTTGSLSTNNFDFQKYSKLILSPNPADDFITVHAEINSEPIEIYNSLGGKVYSGFENKINTSNLSAGFYTVKKGILLTKLIKN
jgi:Secretion system C-terminal sorting domain